MLEEYEDVSVVSKFPVLGDIINRTKAEEFGLLMENTNIIRIAKCEIKWSGYLYFLVFDK